MGVFGSKSKGGSGLQMGSGSERQAFLQSDVNRFLKEGSNIAKTGTAPTAPSLKNVRQFGDRTFVRKAEGQGLGQGFIEESKDSISNITEDQLSALVEAFSRRREEVSARRRAPGRSQTLLTSR